MSFGAQAAHVNAMHAPTVSGSAYSQHQRPQLGGTNASGVPPYFKQFSAIGALGDVDYTLLLVLLFQAYALKKVVGKAGGTRSDSELGCGPRSVKQEISGRKSTANVAERELIVSPSHSNERMLSGNMKSLLSSISSFSSSGSWSGETDTDNRETQTLNWAPSRRHQRRISSIRVAPSDPSTLRFQFPAPFSQIGLDMGGSGAVGHSNSPTASIEEVESDEDLEEFDTAIAGEGSIGTDIESVSTSDAEDYQDSKPVTSEPLTYLSIPEGRVLNIRTSTSNDESVEDLKQAIGASPTTSSSSVSYESLNSETDTGKEPPVESILDSNDVDLGSSQSPITAQVIPTASSSPDDRCPGYSDDDALTVLQKTTHSDNSSSIASESTFCFASWRRRLTSAIWSRSLEFPAILTSTVNICSHQAQSRSESHEAGQDPTIHPHLPAAEVNGNGTSDAQLITNCTAPKKHRTPAILTYLELVLDHVDTLPTLSQKTEENISVAPNWRAIAFKEKADSLALSESSFDDRRTTLGSVPHEASDHQTSSRVGRSRQASSFLSYLELVLDYVDTFPNERWWTEEKQPTALDSRAIAIKEEDGSPVSPKPFVEDRKASPDLVLQDASDFLTSSRVSGSGSQHNTGSTQLLPYTAKEVDDVEVKAPNRREKTTAPVVESVASLTLTELGEGNGGFLSTSTRKEENKNFDQPVLSPRPSLSGMIERGSHCTSSHVSVQQNNCHANSQLSKPTHPVLSSGMTARLSNVERPEPIMKVPNHSGPSSPSKVQT